MGLHQAAYSAEIIRAGILSVDQGQLEAAAALGIPKRRQFFKIVLPQAMRGILPNAANEVISLFKGTSIVSTMAIAELFYQVQVIYGRNGRVVPLLMVATVWYIVLTTVLSIVQYYVERHYAKGAVRTLPLTPWQKLQRKHLHHQRGPAGSHRSGACDEHARIRPDSILDRASHGPPGSEPTSRTPSRCAACTSRSARSRCCAASI